tara:strand:+ start:2320 stop:2961 length:642 start_codon:yes stop_codon:yes gene_type:complete
MDEITRNEPVIKFEKTIAEFFGAPYGVAVDSCTNGLELCFRLDQQQRGKKVIIAKVPLYTYVSIPNMLDKIDQQWKWEDNKWIGYYNLTDEIIDAAVYWKKGGYVPGTKMVLSFQRTKHLSTDRGGMILLDNEEDASLLRKMAYDGRARTDVAWWKQEIDVVGYHYYLSPSKAELGMKNFEAVKDAQVKEKNWDYYRDISNYPIFKTRKFDLK